MSNRKRKKKKEETWLDKETGCSKVAIFFCIALLTVIPAIFMLVCWGIAIYSVVTDKAGKDTKKESNDIVTAPYEHRESNVEQFGEYLYLKKLEDNSYELVTENDSYDKELSWSKADDCYYEYEPNFYGVWYDPSSKEWRYWTKSISGDDKSYGWMRCEENGWEIQDKENEWVRLSEEYDRNDLWYIRSEDDK